VRHRAESISFTCSYANRQSNYGSFELQIRERESVLSQVAAATPATLAGLTIYLAAVLGRA